MWHVQVIEVCFEQLVPKWKDTLGAVDVFGRSHCEKMFVRALTCVSLIVQPHTELCGALLSIGAARRSDVRARSHVPDERALHALELNCTMSKTRFWKRCN